MWDNKTKKLFIFISLILILSSAFAQEEYILEEGELDASDVLEQAQESILQTGNLSEKIDAFMVKNVQNMEQLAGFFNAKIAEQTTAIIIVIVVSNLATLGMAYAIYLFLKSKKLI